SSQIAMHADAAEFIELCNSAPSRAWTRHTMSGSVELSSYDPLNESAIAVLAPAIHKTYQENSKPADKQRFEDLNDFVRRSNCAAARRMIRILDLLGLQLK